MSEWTECPECGAGLKEKNLESHVREKHRREYLDHYPDAVKRGWIPCDECWEWFQQDETVTVCYFRRDDTARTMEVREFAHHVVTEHPGEFHEVLPGSCSLCMLGYHWPRWPPHDDVHGEMADFVWRHGEIDYEAAALYVSNEHGVELEEDDVREHDEEHCNLGPLKVSEAGKYHQLMMEVNHRPTEIERAVVRECEEGEVLTAKELAERTGRTARGIRERAEDMVTNGVIEVEDGTRPVTHRVKGTGVWGEHHFDDSDPRTVPDDELGHEDFESLYGHPPETGPGPRV